MRTANLEAIIIKVRCPYCDEPMDFTPGESTWPIARFEWFAERWPKQKCLGCKKSFLVKVKDSARLRRT